MSWHLAAAAIPAPRPMLTSPGQRRPGGMPPARTQAFPAGFEMEADVPVQADQLRPSCLERTGAACGWVLLGAEQHLGEANQKGHDES